jgi:hypothetical protein
MYFFLGLLPDFLSFVSAAATASPRFDSRVLLQTSTAPHFQTTAFQMSRQKFKTPALLVPNTCSQYMPAERGAHSELETAPEDWVEDRILIQMKRQRDAMIWL